MNLLMSFSQKETPFFKWDIGGQYYKDIMAEKWDSLVVYFMKAMVWSSGQRACLLLRQSKFESCRSLKIFFKFVVQKNKIKAKKESG